MEELNHQLRSQAMGQYLLRRGTDQRHLTSSFYLSGQRTCDFLPGLLALATVVAQFYTPSPREFGQMKKLFSPFAHLSYQRDIETLDVAEAQVGAVHSTDPRLRRQAEHVTFRPSLLWGAGETRRASVEGERQDGRPDLHH